MIKEVDAGSIIDQWPIKVEKDDTVQRLFEKLYPTQYPLLKRAILKITEDDTYE
jgi:folate-dependent phosphoribosylglycinamide formyltransferase PurN